MAADPSPISLIPDTIQVITATQDTFRVALQNGAEFTALLANLPAAPGWWSRTWPVLLGAMIGGSATILAQWFRALLETNREREEVRALLLLVVDKLEGWLVRLASGASAWQVPDARHFWKECDDLLAAQTSLRTMFLLRNHAGVHAWLWLNRVARLRGGAEHIVEQHRATKDPATTEPWSNSELEIYYSRVAKDAEELSQEGEQVRRHLNVATPNRWWQKLGVSMTPMEIVGMKVSPSMEGIQPTKRAAK